MVKNLLPEILLKIKPLLPLFIVIPSNGTIVLLLDNTNILLLAIFGNVIVFADILLADKIPFEVIDPDPKNNVLKFVVMLLLLQTIFALLVPTVTEDDPSALILEPDNAIFPLLLILSCLLLLYPILILLKSPETIFC